MDAATASRVNVDFDTGEDLAAFLAEIHGPDGRSPLTWQSDLGAHRALTALLTAHRSSAPAGEAASIAGLLTPRTTDLALRTLAELENHYNLYNLDSAGILTEDQHEAAVAAVRAFGTLLSEAVWPTQVEAQQR